MNHILRCHEIVKTDFVKGQGCYLYDAHGKRYIDFEAGIWCVALGRSQPRIKQAIRHQSEQIIHLGTRYPSRLAEAVAQDLLDIVGMPDGKCTFLCSGSEAVEFGVQITRHITGQPLMLTLSGSYLGAYGSAGKTTSDQWYNFDWSACTGCPGDALCDRECEPLQVVPFEHLGGFVFEPGTASGQVRFPPKGLVQTIVNRVKEQNGLVAVDEITTGMGRTGQWFGYQHYDFQPDIVAIGKGLGNGYPVSAVAMSAEVAAKLEASKFSYAQSHQNDPLGCAVAREVISVLREDGLVERSKQLGAYFFQELDQLAQRHAVVKEVRGRGLMIAIAFHSRGGRFSASRLYRELLDRGFLVGYHPTANLLRFLPPLTIGEEDIAHLVANLDQLIETTVCQQ